MGRPIIRSLGALKRISLKIAALGLVTSTLAFADAQNDFDEDGISDITYTSNSSSALHWTSVATSDATKQIDLNFQLSDDAPTLAHWKGAGAPVLGVARLDPDGSRIFWKIRTSEQLVDKKYHGKAGDTILSGGDFDGDGTADAAIARVKGATIQWSVRLNMFGDAPRTKNFTFGRKGERIFFCRPSGARTYVGVIGRNGGRSRIRLRNVMNAKVYTYNRFPKSLTSGSRPRPFPIRQESGGDLIGFVTTDQSDTTLQVYSLRGTKIRELTFIGLGTLIPGEYDNDLEGEEVLFQNSDELLIYNPVTGDTPSSQSKVLGTPIGEITIQTIGTAPTPTPTETPTPTPTPDE